MASPITLTEALSLSDVLSNQLFVLDLGTIPGSSGTNDLYLRCQGMTIGEEGNNAYQAKIGPHTRGFRGIGEFSHNMSVRFLETVDSQTSKDLRGWSQKVNGLITGTSSGYLRDYSVKATGTIFDTTGVATEVWTFDNMFIQNISDIDFENEAGQAVMITATFWYDVKKSSLITYR